LDREQADTNSALSQHAELFISDSDQFEALEKRIAQLEKKHNALCGVMCDMTLPHNRVAIRERIISARVDTGDTEAQYEPQNCTNENDGRNSTAPMVSTGGAEVELSVDAIMGEMIAQITDSYICKGEYTSRPIFSPHIVKTVLRPIIERLVGERDDWEEGALDQARQLGKAISEKERAEAELHKIKTCDRWMCGGTGYASYNEDGDKTFCGCKKGLELELAEARKANDELIEKGVRCCSKEKREMRDCVEVLKFLEDWFMHSVVDGLTQLGRNQLDADRVFDVAHKNDEGHCLNRIGQALAKYEAQKGGSDEQCNETRK